MAGLCGRHAQCVAADKGVGVDLAEVSVLHYVPAVAHAVAGLCMRMLLMVVHRNAALVSASRPAGKVQSRSVVLIEKRLFVLMLLVLAAYLQGCH